MKIDSSYAGKDKYVGRGINAFALKSQLLKEINKRSKDQKSFSLLEVGCGQGNLLLDLAKLYPKIKLVGLNKNVTHGVRDEEDIKRRAAERGIKIGALPQVLFGDATKLPFPSESFDVVISQMAFLHIQNKARALEEAYCVLKLGGIALIGLSSYSIKRKLGYAMPPYYRSLRRKLGHDFNPRFLIKSNNNKFIGLSEFVQKTRGKYDVSLETGKFVSELHRGIAQWLILNKKNKGKLDLGLKYNKEESRKLTEAYAKKNPVNWGVIDVYQYSDK